MYSIEVNQIGRTGKRNPAQECSFGKPQGVFEREYWSRGRMAPYF